MNNLRALYYKHQIRETFRKERLNEMILAAFPGAEPCEFEPEQEPEENYYFVDRVNRRSARFTKMTDEFEKLSVALPAPVLLFLAKGDLMKLNLCRNRREWFAVFARLV